MLCFSHDACTAVFSKTMYLDRQRYTVFWPYTICRPNTKTKISRTTTHTHPHRRSVFFFLHVAIRNSLRSNNNKNGTFRRNVGFVEASWSQYRCCQNVELSTGNRDSTSIKSVVPRHLLGRRRTLWLRARARRIAVEKGDNCSNVPR